MQKAIIIGMGLLIIMMSGLAIGSNAQSVDIHNLNAQILVNTNFTDGYKGYLTAQYPNGTISDSLFITVRSPGNSTFSLIANGLYIFNSVAFINITTQPFSISPSNYTTFIIVIHSYELNFTRILKYHGTVLTPVQYISYESALYRHPSAILSYSASAVFLNVGISLLGAFAFTLITFYSINFKRSRMKIDDGGN